VQRLEQVLRQPELRQPVRLQVLRQPVLLQRALRLLLQRLR